MHLGLGRSPGGVRTDSKGALVLHPVMFIDGAFVGGQWNESLHGPSRAHSWYIADRNYAQFITDGLEEAAGNRDITVAPGCGSLGPQACRTTALCVLCLS